MTPALIVTVLYFITAGLLVSQSKRLLGVAGIGTRDTVKTLAVLTLIGRLPPHSATMSKWSRFGHVWAWVFRAGLTACLVLEAMKSRDMLSFSGLVLSMIMLSVLLVRFLPRMIHSSHLSSHESL